MNSCRNHPKLFVHTLWYCEQLFWKPGISTFSFLGTVLAQTQKCWKISIICRKWAKKKLSAANSWTWVEVRILGKGWKTFKTISPIIFWQEKPSLGFCFLEKTSDLQLFFSVKMTKKTQILDFDHFTGFELQNRPRKIDQRKISVPEKVLESIL